MGSLQYYKSMKRTISYSQMDPISQSLNQDYYERQKTTKLEPDVKVALIEVAGKWAMELNKSKPDLTANDLVKSFRDAYSSLILIFLIPEV